MDKVNPNNESGKVVLICRMGSEKVNEHLPRLIKNIKANGKNVTWCCDPMHGNTIKASNGYKTRRVLEILNEVIRNIKPNKIRMLNFSFHAQSLSMVLSIN